MKLKTVIEIFNSKDPKQQCEWIINSTWDHQNFLELLENIGNDDIKDILKILTICNYYLEKNEPLLLENIYPLWLEEVRNNKLNKLGI